MPERPPEWTPSATGLRAVAEWLATQLDDAGFYRAAAYASMTADAIGKERGLAEGKGKRKGPSRE